MSRPQPLAVLFPGYRGQAGRETSGRVGGGHRGLVTGLLASGGVFAAASVLWLSPLGRPTPVAGATGEAVRGVRGEVRGEVRQAPVPTAWAMGTSTGPKRDAASASPVMSDRDQSDASGSHRTEGSGWLASMAAAMPEVVTVPVPVPVMVEVASGAADHGELSGADQIQSDPARRSDAADSETAVDPDRPRRVLYLVDASGSLLDTLPDAVEWVGQHLDTLEEDQRFAVLFFRDVSVLEAEPAGMQPARFAVKAKVWSWMQPEAGHVEATGRSDVSGALERAMAYEPDAIYILSDDGFSRRSAWGDGPEMIERFAASLAEREVRVHTVQFYYRDEAGALEALASRFDGTYEFIEAAASVPPVGFDLLSPMAEGERGADEGLAAAGVR